MSETKEKVFIPLEELERMGWEKAPYGGKIVTQEDPGTVYVRVDPGLSTVDGQPSGNTKTVKFGNGDRILRKHDTTKWEIVEVLSGHVEYIAQLGNSVNSIIFGRNEVFTSIANDPERTGNLHTMYCYGSEPAILRIVAAPLEVKQDKRA